MNIRIIMLLFVVLGCQNRSSTPLIKSSSGNINTISVVMPDLLWETEVGDAVRAAFAFPAEGLPQKEPLYDLKQIPPEVFTGFTRLSRMILWVGFGEEVVIRTDKNRYARPQQMAVLSAPDMSTLVEMVLSQSSGIIKSFKKGELAERQRRTLKSTLNQNALKYRFGIDLTIPSAYKVFKEGNSTVWFQREIRKGHVNLIVYELPGTTKIDFEQPLTDIISIRDSVGQAFIPGRLAKTHLITEAAYEPYVYETSVDGIRAIETRGTWEVKGDFMAGPFLQFLLDDEKNNRYLVMEGFVFAPTAAKRDYVFETEAIMQSMQQQKKD